MKKLPPNAKRVIVNGNPYIAHEDPVTKKIRLEDDYATALARKPVCSRYAKNKTRVAKRGEVV
jgi:hypothetical protein